MEVSRLIARWPARCVIKNLPDRHRNPSFQLTRRNSRYSFLEFWLLNFKLKYLLAHLRNAALIPRILDSFPYNLPIEALLMRPVCTNTIKKLRIYSRINAVYLQALINYILLHIYHRKRRKIKTRLILKDPFFCL